MLRGLVPVPDQTKYLEEYHEWSDSNIYMMMLITSHLSPPFSNIYEQILECAPYVDA